MESTEKESHRECNIIWKTAQTLHEVTEWGRWWVFRGHRLCCVKRWERSVMFIIERLNISKILLLKTKKNVKSCLIKLYRLFRSKATWYWLCLIFKVLTGFHLFSRRLFTWGYCSHPTPTSSAHGHGGGRPSGEQRSGLPAALQRPSVSSQHCLARRRLSGVCTFSTHRYIWQKSSIT